MRDQLYDNILDGLGEEKVKLNGPPTKRLPNTLNISLSGVVGEELLGQIPEFAASTGAACHSGSTEPSQVLIEMGLGRELALGALRLSLGRWSTEDEVGLTAELIIEHAKRLVSL